MTTPHHKMLYQTLLSACYDLYEAEAALRDFAPLPEACDPQQITPRQHPGCAHFLNSDSIAPARYEAFERAIREAAPALIWPHIYRPSADQPDDIDFRFADRLATCEIIGYEAPFTSEEMHLYFVYLPPDTFYPWHKHPAEELYFVLSGEAIFQRENKPDQTLTSGDHIIHETQEAHAIHTTDKPLISLAVWRNHLGIMPDLIANPHR